MRACSPALFALLTQAPQVLVADLLTLALVDGTTVVRLTSADVPVTTPDGRTFAVGGPATTGPIFARNTVKTQVGTAVASMTLTLYPDPATHRLGGLPWPAAVAAGATDGARVTLERAFFAQAGAAPTGTLLEFSGRVAKADPSRTAVVFTVNSDLELLNVQMPRTLYQPGCAHALYDSGCGLARAAWQVAGTAAAGGSSRLFGTSLPQPDGYFELGTVTFTGGANAGLARTIKQHAGGALTVALPFPTAPAAGDAFVAVPGCHKTQAECAAKYNNLVHFKGFPFVPTPETVGP